MIGGYLWFSVAAVSGIAVRPALRATWRSSPEKENKGKEVLDCSHHVIGLRLA